MSWLAWLGIGGLILLLGVVALRLWVGALGIPPEGDE